MNIVDPRTGYRESTIKDLFDIGRIVDVMEHIHFFQRAVVPRDIPDPFEMDFNTCYASVVEHDQARRQQLGAARARRPRRSRCCT